MDSITFKAEDVAKFQKVYEKALEDGVDVFVYEEKEFYVPYAKYMLEYLHNKFDQKS